MAAVPLQTTAPVTVNGQDIIALNVSAYHPCHFWLDSMLSGPALSVQPFALLLAKTVVYVLLLTRVLALLAGLDQLVMKVREYFI